jgi:glycine/D-amino acid oxidase-like deaminating enzyme/nitrite reductase/ring-hydroxylating ferredoxin subunit
MTREGRGSLSLWMASTQVPCFSSLSHSLDTEVCVIGGGIAGMTTAYLLAKEGKDVVLLEARELGSGETGRTTAHFFPPDDRYYQIERAFGADGARTVADSFAAATNRVEAIVQAESIDCQFERLEGYLFSLSPDGEAILDREFAAARRAGVSVAQCSQVPGLSFGSGPCLRFINQAQFHPLRYLSGLAEAFVANRGRIFTQTRAVDIRGDARSKTVKTEHGEVRADAVVVATNTPFNNRVVMHTKQAGYRTYVIGVRVPRGSVPRILLWDIGDPYFYVRLATPDTRSEYEVLVVGGEDHKVGQDEHPEPRYDRLEAWVRERYPMAGPVDFRWSGEVMEPADGLAYLGRNPLDDDNVFIITGDSGNGMTHCTAGAMLVSDLIMGRENPWADLYAPARKVTYGFSEFVKEQANTLAHYGDWLKKRGEARSIHEIPPGEGAIVREGTSVLAVYRAEEDASNESGTVWHVLSAACTHLGCVVTWNSAEKSWDCPCHGSRFDIRGQVLHGPAMHPLHAVRLPSEPAPPPPAEQPGGRPVHWR